MTPLEHDELLTECQIFEEKTVMRTKQANHKRHPLAIGAKRRFVNTNLPQGNLKGVGRDSLTSMTLFVQKNQKVRGGRRLPKLRQERCHLTVVVGRMVYGVLQHMSQRVLPSRSLKVLV